MTTYSIVVRVRRVVTEEVHISVPVTGDLMKPDPEPDGTYRLRPGAVFEEALRLARQTTEGWRPEGEPEVLIHPVQTPPPGFEGDKSRA